MPVHRRKAVTTLCAIALAVMGAVIGPAGSALSADWPTRTVSIVVPYAPGGGTDIMARLIAQRLTEKYGKPFVVDNRGGASGTIGTGYIARAAADGYTLLYVGAVPTIIVPMMQKVPYDPQKDLIPVSIFGTGNYILATKPSLPVSSLAELIAYAKERPGKLNYASVGPGGLQHLGVALLAQRAAIDLVHVPYNGTMAVSALMSGDVELYLGTSGEMIGAGTDKVKRLAVGSSKRIPQLPDLPTIAETLPGFRVAGWNGLFAPAGTPPDIVNMLAKDFAGLAREPATAQKLTELAIEPVGSTMAEFADVMNAERISYRDALIITNLLKKE
jgi:tripartite-type tricarboxylate transporter receptor subunit TctC